MKDSPSTLDQDIFWRDIHRFIEEKKQEVDDTRKQRRSQSKSPSRQCPDCKKTMSQKEINKILIDICANCGGIFLDKGELDLLFKGKQSSGLIASLKSYFGQP